MQPRRYLRNALAISPDEQERLAECRALVVGCGGLGGFVLEYLGRLGVGGCARWTPTHSARAT